MMTFSIMPTTLESATAEIHADRQEILRLRAELAAERAKVTELELENSMINYETVAWYEGHDDAVRGVAQRWREALTEPIPKAGVMNEPLESLYRDTEKLRQQIADLAAQLAAKESAEQEPVAWLIEHTNGGRELAFRDNYTLVRIRSSTPLYTSPPTVQAAVSAALMKAVAVCENARRLKDSDDMARSIQCQILAIPADESALREYVRRGVLVALWADPRANPDQIVAEVLGK